MQILTPIQKHAQQLAQSFDDLFYDLVITKTPDQISQSRKSIERELINLILENVCAIEIIQALNTL